MFRRHHDFSHEDVIILLVNISPREDEVGNYYNSGNTSLEVSDVLGKIVPGESGRLKKSSMPG